MARNKSFGWIGLHLAGTIRPLPRLGWHRLTVKWGGPGGMRVSNLPISELT